MTIRAISCPGPQPLTHTSQLVGRNKETAEIVRACRDHHIVEVTAASGAGKTSFVRAGLIPRLEQHGTYVPTYKTWANAIARLRGAAPENATEAAEMLYRLWIGADPLDFRSLGEILHEASGGRRTVVVLDQVEELLRYRPAIGADLLRLAGTTAKETGTPHVVVARTEFRERLWPVEVVGADVWAMGLTELDSDPVLEAISRSLLDVKGEATLDDDACKLLVTWWKAARAPAQFDGATQTQVGLTHLQALIWSFTTWAAASSAGDQTAITVDLLEDFRVARAKAKAEREGLGVAEASTQAGGEWLLTDALLHYVDDRASRLVTPQEVAVEGDPHRKLLWRNGPQLMLARIAPAMSAAGYKQPQSLFSLVSYALGDELTPRVARDFARALQHEPLNVRELCKAIPLGGAGIAAVWGDAHEPSKHRLGERIVVEEMIDCLRAALKAMTRANILREFEQDDPIYELVHDSMGAALNTWAQSFLESPIATIGVVAPQPGRILTTSIDGAELRELSTDDLGGWGAERDSETDEVVLAALRWPGSVVGGEKRPIAMSDLRFRACDFVSALLAGIQFENVTFESCDLTSAFFSACRFQNVTFDSCVLRAAAMRGCTFENVTFTTKIGTEQDLGLLTIIRPQPGAEVTFEHATATGVFLQAIGKGSWTFADTTIHHLVIEESEPARFTFAGSLADAVSVTGEDDPALWSIDADSDVRRVELIDRSRRGP